MKPVRKAVFPVAGMGTRFLPATKASPKEMLPVVDEPLIQYGVDEAIEAGAEVLVFINGRNKRAIPDHFDAMPELERALKDKGKDRELELIRDIVPPHVSCVYIRQPEALGLGHAVACAQSVVVDEPFMVILADDLIDGQRKSAMAQMRDLYDQTGSSVIGVQQVPKDEIYKYGVITPEVISERVNKVLGMVEKPKPEDAPSDLAVVGRYILDARIFELIKTTPRGAGGEIQLTDAIAAMALERDVLSYQFEGTRYDCGSKLGFLQANVEYGLKHPELADDFRKYLRELAGRL